MCSASSNQTVLVRRVESVLEMIVYPPPVTMATRRGVHPRFLKKMTNIKTPKRQVVQWKQTNVEHGVVIVDEKQLLKLIKTEPIEKFYELDPEPFAT